MSSRLGRVRFVLGVVGAVLLASACGSPSATAPHGERRAEIAATSDVPPFAQLSLAAVPSAERTRLEGALTRGFAVVRFVSGKLEVLDRCSAEGG